MRVDVAKNKHIEIKIKNGRDLLLLHNSDTVKIIKENNNIVELDFYDKVAVKINEDIEVQIPNNRLKYNITSITRSEDDEYSFELSCCKITKSSVFLMPLVCDKDIDRSAYFYNTYFYNAYIKLDGLEEFNDGRHLFLVYRYINSEYFKELEAKIYSSKYFVKTYEPNRNFTVFIMELPLMFQNDSKLIMKGKYSAISTTAKARIMTFHKAHIESELSHILQRNQKLKDKLEEYLKCTIPDNIDLCTKPFLTEEIFTYDNK